MVKQNCQAEKYNDKDSCPNPSRNFKTLPKRRERNIWILAILNNNFTSDNFIINDYWKKYFIR
jgi:hypothetical protein